MELIENTFSEFFGRDSNNGCSSERDRLLGSVDVVHDDARVSVLVGLLRRDFSLQTEEAASRPCPRAARAAPFLD